jgi:hypothetical protein
MAEFKSLSCRGSLTRPEEVLHFSALRESLAGGQINMTLKLEARLERLERRLASKPGCGLNGSWNRYGTAARGRRHPLALARADATTVADRGIQVGQPGSQDAAEDV